MALFWQALKGPKLLRVFRSETEPGQIYEPRMLESGADKLIGTIRFCWSLSYWTSPLLIGILYRRGHFTTEGIVNISKFVLFVGLLYYSAIFVRGISRFMNPEYMAFSAVLINAHRLFNEQNRKLLNRYDYQFWAAPVYWNWKENRNGVVRRAKVQPEKKGSLLSWPFSYVCAHTFGRRMVYPGSTALINTLVEGPLSQGRAKLVEEKNGDRAKLLTEDENEIDTMFVDRRHIQTPEGNTLVICTEGNAGFYEIGIMEVPLSLGYSAIGWNHPGFGGSTGVPFPSQEQCAIDAVMQYAINKLGFTPENIVLYAWSIGGYSASWAAMTYPDVKFVILDATFDEIMPLAMAKMPDFAKSLVETTVNRFLNLDIAGQLIKYSGPVTLIRRSRDEMITTQDPTAIHTNRGNHLLLKLLKYRYPFIVDDTTSDTLMTWLSLNRDAREQLLTTLNEEHNYCETALKSYIESQGMNMYPCEIGQNFNQTEKNHMTLLLAHKYMKDYDSTHCTPLPASLFSHPWAL